jgi:hypothetical protein
MQLRREYDHRLSWHIETPAHVPTGTARADGYFSSLTPANAFRASRAETAVHRDSGTSRGRHHQQAGTNGLVSAHEGDEIGQRRDARSFNDGPTVRDAQQRSSAVLVDDDTL